MKTYIIFGKSDLIIPVDVLANTASEEIAAFMEQGFTILSTTCEAENAEQAVNTWEEQIKNKENYEYVKTSSTNLISADLTITENFGVITSTIVSGTNVIRDILASVSDVVGGKSVVYINKIDQIKAEALMGLRKQAAEKKCNAIVGVSIDVDEISGSGKSMFMVTAIGTAVVVK